MPNESEKQDWLHNLREMRCSDASAQRIIEALEASDRKRATELLRIPICMMAAARAIFPLISWKHSIGSI